MKIRPASDELYDPVRQVDGHDAANSQFSQDGGLALQRRTERPVVNASG